MIRPKKTQFLTDLRQFHSGGRSRHFIVPLFRKRYRILFRGLMSNMWEYGAIEIRHEKSLCHVKSMTRCRMIAVGGRIYATRGEGRGHGLEDLKIAWRDPPSENTRVFGIRGFDNEAVNEFFPWTRWITGYSSCLKYSLVRDLVVAVLAI